MNNCLAVELNLAYLTSRFVKDIQKEGSHFFLSEVVLTLFLLISFETI